MRRRGRIGLLRRRLRLLEPVDVPDGVGGLERTWVERARPWARVRPARRRETVEGGRPVGLLVHRIVLRRRDDVASGLVLADGARRYRILTVEPEGERGDYVACLAEEETP